jgi:hypothetical protein
MTSEDTDLSQRSAPCSETSVPKLRIETSSGEFGTRELRKEISWLSFLSSCFPDSLSFQSDGETICENPTVR